VTAVDESSLPTEINAFAAVEAAYPEEIARVHQALKRQLPVLVECDKELVPYFYKALRDRLKQDEKKCSYLDGRPDPNAAPNPNGPQGIIATLLGQLRDIVRGAVENRVVVLPHLDLLVTSQGGLTSEAREVIPLLYENPGLLWIGFKDPSFPLPKVIENLFPHHETVMGMHRERLQHVVTQRESRKFGKTFNPFALYKYVSGVNAVRLRRLLGSVEGEDYPENPQPAFDQLRSGTMASEMELPSIDIDNDIGGYKRVKDQLHKEILDIIARKDKLTDPAAIERIESLIPKGMIFFGPPGTGKTLFAKAMATSLGAAVQIISGPELKSKWVGQSEENIRRVFARARQSAPSIIVFDELDSIAPARGTYMGSGVEHSMVNQLLTELDGFRKNEMVFVVGTTNFPSSLDPALLRPGRMEFKLNIGWPEPDDRRAIFAIYNDKLGLEMDDDTIDYCVRRTKGMVEEGNSRYTGDHIYAVCRAIARRRIRADAQGPTKPDDYEAAIEEFADRPEMTEREELLVATHECGHAICHLYTENLPPVERISIRGDIGGALGYVMSEDPTDKHIQTVAQFMDGICVAMGGREAEVAILGSLATGSVGDIQQATNMARYLVETCGLGPPEVGVRRYADLEDKRRDPELSERTKQAIEDAVLEILETQRQRAEDIVTEHKDELLALRDLLLEKKVLDRTALNKLSKG
jgi:cell division protease FtsH